MALLLESSEDETLDLGLVALQSCIPSGKSKEFDTSPFFFLKVTDDTENHENEK